ncbi:MAG: hypothetical protein ACE5G1_06280 [bacterium]
MSKSIIRILVILILFNLGSTVESYGQVPNDIAKAIERLNRSIEQVRELIGSFRNNDARKLFEQAERLRDEAVTAIHNRQVMEARAKIDLAFSLLKKATELSLSVPVRRLQSQLEELIQRADQHVLGGCDKEAERVLREAKSRRDQAMRAATSGHSATAAEHYRLAVELALRSIDIVNRTRDTIEQEKRKFENMAERAHEILETCNKSDAKQIFQRARNLAFEAEQALQDCKQALARRLYNHSMLLLVRAMDICSRDKGVDRLSRAKIKLFQLRNRIEDVQGVLSQGRFPNARRLLNRVNRFANEAERAIEQNHERKAISKIQLAENMLNRARRRLRPGLVSGASERISSEIASTKEEISEAYAKLTPDSPKDVEILLRMADVALHRAEEASVAGFNRFALEAVLAAQKFLTRAAHLSTTRRSGQFTQEKIQLRLNQLDASIAEAQERVSEQNEDWLLQLLDSAKDIRQIAFESFQKGNYAAANGGIQVAFELTRKIMNNTAK